MEIRVLALTAALGNFVRLTLLLGDRKDTVDVAPLIRGLKTGELRDQKAYDSNWIIQDMNAGGALF